MLVLILSAREYSRNDPKNSVSQSLVQILKQFLRGVFVLKSVLDLLPRNLAVTKGFVLEIKGISVVGALNYR